MAHIILVDDHEVVMDSLKYMLEMETIHKIAAKFKNGKSFLDYIEENKTGFDLAIIDIKLPDISGLDLVKKLRQKDPEAKIILLSQHADKEFIITGYRNGISGYLLKSSAGQDLIEAVELVLEGGKYVSPEMAKLILKTKFDDDFNIQLTGREKEILDYISKGMTSKDIAQQLNIESSTVDFHKKNLKLKFKVKKSTEMIKKAYDLGLVCPE